MRLLLTGATGQFGRRFAELADAHEIIPVGHGPGAHAALSLEDPAACDALVASARPDWIVHAAAMTNVDACERDPRAAHQVNAEGTCALAGAAARAGARMLYVSTDYVFDGAKGSYVEDDATRPINAYGASKLAGEALGREHLPDMVIARTSVVFGPHKSNFASWLIGELSAGRRVRIVHDQRVTPTLTYDLAGQTLALIEADATGTFHTAGATALSRLEMARAIADVFHLDPTLIEPVASSELSWVAARPLDSTLATLKVSKYRSPLSLSDALLRFAAERDALRAGRPLPR